ncbi:hypothetical protein LGH83_10180 [Lichenihabitans sp. PAMC28606]|uniref:GCG_CRPN prefix-to-repeats domain-containing protein n=1 Tax=Lichenihabitans sp. PAMC28606 TaxID=2880932 RepID=UPI001D09AC38|nr:hypothetical protein [Lichenihabitans sp. PAMC28606]UDL93005.1 hypothetical protein LGH83_10180 [Lichenihabitans sp. PAMC28606]
MRKILGLAAAAVMMFGLGAVGAEAMPLSNALQLGDAPAVTLVRDGCGPFGHRSNYGYCKGNGGPVYARPFYGPRPYYGGRRCFVRETPYGPRRICR